ncbi:DNA fragmentation factor subunit beta isoform X1 [Myiozetetes cayanensis]|uniref:DNA fragmentation factor subunit beta isoform X1 n=1 Tax=Myiozetetes cayanensis TaxID=478635 RepID=UPI00215F4FF2|nr:DNA fragmentation factor subunit beta isoform X1 [Myiozetetes cayanensis]
MAEPPRPFRLRGAGGPQKFGVAAGSLRGLLRKGCRLLQLPLAGSRLCLYEDGTELTESYFRVLPPQTELLLLGPGQSWRGCASDIERLLAALCSQRDALVEAARKLLTDERAPRRQKLLADLIHNLSENILAEDKEDDKKWFEGLESRFKNKSSYMRHSCESRMRGYMREVSGFISNVHPAARDAYRGVMDLMADKLKSVKYNGCYFDRREEEEAARLCTVEGWFSCQVCAALPKADSWNHGMVWVRRDLKIHLIPPLAMGDKCDTFHCSPLVSQGPFDRDDCPCKHSINPYSNRESRILFSTWNLDHIIEKKRAVVPELAEAVKTRDGREVNWEYFYQLLFTLDNLKLVHIACHKKTTHNLSCDKTKIYRKRKQNHEIS